VDGVQDLRLLKCRIPRRPVLSSPRTPQAPGKVGDDPNPTPEVDKRTTDETNRAGDREDRGDGDLDVVPG